MFCSTGFHAVSIDAIIAEAGVARMTVYKNFGSKEDLIVATLRREDKLFLLKAFRKVARYPARFS